MERSYNADFINEVINHPDVRDSAEVEGIGDLTEFVANVNNVLLTNKHGGFLFVSKGAGIYEVHTQFLPSGRGHRALLAAIDSLYYMFIHTDCIRVISRAKPENTGACQLADRLLIMRGNNGVYNYYSLEYMDWVESEKRNSQEGHDFHGVVDTDHGNDDTHDYHVGAALLMAKAGNAKKAVQVYNYWAMMSGYEQATIYNYQPIIVQIGDMRLQITDTVEVI